MIVHTAVLNVFVDNVHVEHEGSVENNKRYDNEVSDVSLNKRIVEINNLLDCLVVKEFELISLSKLIEEVVELRIEIMVSSWKIQELKLDISGNSLIFIENLFVNLLL